MRAIAVLGPGGVGGFVAAALARPGTELARPGTAPACPGTAPARPGTEVVVVAREDTAEMISRNGLAVTSVRLGEFIAHPRAQPVLTDQVDTLFVATKATGLRDGLARVEAEPNLVVPLLNGLDHMALLRERFGRERVAAGSIRIESDRPEPGRVIQTSPFLRVDLASDHPRLRPRLEELAGILGDAEIPAQVEDSEAQVLWSKLVRLNALACTTSAADKPVGFLRGDPEWRETLEACIYEAAAVASAEGATIDPAARLAELDAAHPELGSSMQRDIAAGREPELDAIPGSVLRAAARHGLACPTIARLTVEIARRARIAPPRTS